MILHIYQVHFYPVSWKHIVSKTCEREIPQKHIITKELKQLQYDVVC